MLAKLEKLKQSIEESEAKTDSLQTELERVEEGRYRIYSELD